MDVKAVAVGLHERERPDALLCILRRCIGQQSTQNR